MAAAGFHEDGLNIFRKVIVVMVLALALSGCGGGGAPPGATNISLPSPPAGSPDITGTWTVYLCDTGPACTPQSPSYIATLNLSILQEPAAYYDFPQNRWASVLDGSNTGASDNVGTCVVADLRNSDSSLEWTGNYPAEPASIYIDMNTDTQGDYFTMQSSSFTNATSSGTWWASSGCGGGAPLTGAYQMQQTQ